MKNEKVLMLGDINVDTVWPVPQFPAPGQNGLAEDVKAAIGGAVVNSAIALDHLGLKTRLLGCIGNDVWADNIRRGLSQTSIDLSHLQVDAEVTTGLTFIIVTPDGERTMFSYRGANIQLRQHNIDKEIFKGVSLLHISGYALLEEPQRSAVWRAVELAKDHGIPISLDTGLEPAIKNPEDMRRLLRELTICVSGPEEISALLGTKSQKEAADRLLSLGVQVAGIKLGEGGSYIANGETQFLCPSFPVNAIDTTGAGDLYSAGLLYGWVKRLSLSASAVLASALGALAASIYGAGLSLPKKQDVIDFLKSSKSQFTPDLREGIEEAICVLEGQ
ncbi:MAG: carbohydrate kinase family protein [Anaerolineaceae bacterium]|nr:carbohydrate kinase family protein [Anaerolineaceae bacterium]